MMEHVKVPVEEKEKVEDEKEPELSDEHKDLQDEVNFCIEVLSEVKRTLPILNQLPVKICASTTSVTSVPKRLKFLCPHYTTLKSLYEEFPEGEIKRLCADIISILAMAISEERECLKYHLYGSREEIGYLGLEYVRHLSGEIAQEWMTAMNKDNATYMKQLTDLVEQIVPYLLAHEAEAEACDLARQTGRLDLLIKNADEDALPRLTRYLTSDPNVFLIKEENFFNSDYLKEFRRLEEEAVKNFYEFLASKDLESPIYVPVSSSSTVEAMKSCHGTVDVGLHDNA